MTCLDGVTFAVDNISELGADNGEIGHWNIFKFLDRLVDQLGLLLQGSVLIRLCPHVFDQLRPVAAPSALSRGIHNQPRRDRKSKSKLCNESLETMLSQPFDSSERFWNLHKPHGRRSRSSLISFHTTLSAPLLITTQWSGRTANFQPHVLLADFFPRRWPVSLGRGNRNMI